MAFEYLENLKAKLKTKKGNALSQLKALSRAMNVSSEREDTLVQLHQPGNRGLHVRLLGALVRGISPIMAEVIQKGCDEGVFSTKYPLEVAEILIAGVQFATDEGIYPWGPGEVSRRKEAIPPIAEALLQAPNNSLKFLFT
jgi:hypothetical protein